jgi:hypothetical protein
MLCCVAASTEGNDLPPKAVSRVMMVFTAFDRMIAATSARQIVRRRESMTMFSSKDCSPDCAIHAIVGAMRC